MEQKVEGIHCMHSMPFLWFTDVEQSLHTELVGVSCKVSCLGCGFHLSDLLWIKQDQQKQSLPKDTLLLGQPTLWEIGTVGSLLFLRIWLDSNTYVLGLHYNCIVSLKQWTLP